MLVSLHEGRESSSAVGRKTKKEKKIEGVGGHSDSDAAQVHERAGAQLAFQVVQLAHGHAHQDKGHQQGPPKQARVRALGSWREEDEEKVKEKKRRR